MPKSKGKVKADAGSKQKTGGGKGKGIISSVITFITVILVISLVLGGAFYVVVHNNINGLGERYRTALQNIPLLKLALPAVADPSDPKYMSTDEIKAKYIEFRAAKDELNKQLAEAQKQLKELQKYKDDYDKMKAEVDKASQENKDRQASLDEKQVQLDALKKKIDELVANGDKEGFKTYFEGVDAENAKQIYAEVVKQLQIDENTKKFAQVYETMDASAAAQIFEQMGNSKIDLIAQTLKAMKKESSSAIMAAMTPTFASKVTEKLDALYKENG